MALKICEDCEKEISSIAISCPHCGRPNANEGIVTIEKTQKKYKRWDLLGILLAVPGGLYVFLFGVTHSAFPNPKPIFVLFFLIALVLGVVGIGIGIASGIGRWYHHG
jgi:hypothetical protein